MLVQVENRQAEEKKLSCKKLPLLKKKNHKSSKQPKQLKSENNQRI